MLPPSAIKQGMAWPGAVGGLPVTATIQNTFVKGWFTILLIKQKALVGLATVSFSFLSLIEDKSSQYHEIPYISAAAGETYNPFDKWGNLSGLK